MYGRLLAPAALPLVIAGMVLMTAVRVFALGRPALLLSGRTLRIGHFRVVQGL